MSKFVHFYKHDSLCWGVYLLWDLVYFEWGELYIHGRVGRWYWYYDRENRKWGQEWLPR